MITAAFHLEDSRIVSVCVRGHAESGEEGHDLVCAAVTSAVRLAECTLNDVRGLSVPVKVNEKNAQITWKLPKKSEGEEEDLMQTVLSGLMVYFTQLSDEYPENIIVTEE